MFTSKKWNDNTKITRDIKAFNYLGTSEYILKKAALRTKGISLYKTFHIIAIIVFTLFTVLQKDITIITIGLDRPLHKISDYHPITRP